MKSFATKQRYAQTPASSSPARSRPETANLYHRDSLPDLQHTLGNQAVQRLLEANDGGAATAAASRLGYDSGAIAVKAPAAGALRTRLSVSKPGDAYEQEADRIAQQVAPAPGGIDARASYLQRLSPQAHARTEAAPADLESFFPNPGRPLEPALRRDMEQRFGRDFSRVRVHCGPDAERSARNLNADAYTVGNDIVFGAGRFAPHTHQGQRLIAHELAHVTQQQASRISIQRQPAGGGQPAPPPHDPFDVYDQLDIIREAQLPLEFYERAEIRKLTFADREAMEFQRKLKAIFRLGDFRDERAVPTLIAVLEDKVFNIKSLSPQQKLILQRAAAESLARIGGKAALSKLNDLLTSKDPKDRLMASGALSQAAGGQSVIDLLAALKKESDPDVKARIISALGNVGGRSSSHQEKETIAKELIREMGSATGPVMPAAVNALGQLKLKIATEPLLNQLKSHVGIASLEQDIIRALGEIGDERAVGLLVIMLEKNGSKFVRSEAAIALGKIRSPKALDALRRAQQQESEASVKADIVKAIHGPPVLLQWSFP